MSAKINLTLKQDEQRGTNAAMEETIKLLATLEALPITKVVVTLECEEMIAANYRRKLHDGLRRRPIGIIAKIKTTSEEQITVEYVPKPTPMDDVLDDESTTLNHNSRSVTFTSEDMRNVSEMLRNSSDLFEE